MPEPMRRLVNPTVVELSGPAYVQAHARATAARFLATEQARQRALDRRMDRLIADADAVLPDSFARLKRDYLALSGAEPDPDVQRKLARRVAVLMRDELIGIRKELAK